MSKRNLAFVTLVIALIAVGSHFFINRQKSGGDTRVGQTLTNSDVVGEMDEIEIVEADTRLHLKKAADGWMITEKDDFPVNMEKVFQLINQLTNSKIASLVTKDTARFAHFKVKQDGDWQQRGTKLSIKKSGSAIFQLLIGKHRNKLTSKEGNGIPDGTYIRFSDQDSVYLIKENLSYKTDPDEWIRTRLFKINKDEFKMVSLENPQNISFSRKDKSDKFQLLGNSKTKIDNQKALSLVDELDEFSLVKIQKNSSDFSSGLVRKSKVSLSLFDGSSLSFQLFEKGKEDDKEYWVKFLEANDLGKNGWSGLVSLSKNWYFNIYSFQAEYFLKTKKDFIP
ncbi:MAG: DUF4340 domain-containing protein [Proteobacteria bacterium]|nr:DUF4340 domain-containing protein [Pseudomonadota bacterium]